VTVVSSVIVVSAVTPPVLLAIFALALIYRQIQKRYVATSRELKRCARDGPPVDSCLLDTGFVAPVCVARSSMPLSQSLGHHVLQGRGCIASCLVKARLIADTCVAVTRCKSL